MNYRAPHQKSISWVDRLTLWLIAGLSGFLRKRSPDLWKSRVISETQKEALSIGRQEPSVYKANKTKELESLVQQASSGDTARQISSRVSLPAWAREIQPFLQNQLSDHTRRAYETDLKHFFQFLDGRLSPDEVTRLKPEHIILYRKHLEEGRLTGKVMEKSTINRKLAVVKSFLNWLKLNHLLIDNPAQLVKGYPQTQESSLKGLSDDEARRMLLLPRLNSKAGALHCAILHTLLYMGIRKAELLGLRMGDITEERGTPVLKIRGKGHRVRILPLTPIVKASLQHYFHVCRRDATQTEAPVFTPTKNPRFGVFDQPMNPNAITYIVIRYAKKAGVLKKVSPHSCRATCISNALDKKATHRAVQYLAGWSTPLMIQRYDKRREDLQNSAAYLVDYGEAAT